MPNLVGIPGVPATDKLLKGGCGQTGPFGQEITVAGALASAVGVKLEPYPADAAYQRMNMQIRQAKKKIDSDVLKATRELQTGGFARSSKASSRSSRS